MREPDVAIVFTPELWVEELHRFFADHGGARVRQLIVDPALALSEQYAVLIVSWRWPAMTRGLVAQLHDQGRRVLGVGDSEEPAAQELLESWGVDAVVSCDAAHHEFLAAVLLVSDADTDGLIAPRERGESIVAAAPFPLIVAAGPGGSGTSEIALELARAYPGLLVDCDEMSPSVAPRLGLAIEPNLRTAIDAAEHGLGAIDDCVVLDPGRDVEVVAGLANVRAWTQVRSTEVVRTLRALNRERAVVVDTSSAIDDVGTTSRSRYEVTRGVLLEADAICTVGLATPVGIVRLLTWIADLCALRPEAPIHIVLNRAPSDRFRRAELVDEVTRAFRGSSITIGPDDRRVNSAVWAGSCVRTGPFTRAIAQVADAIADGIAHPRFETTAPAS